MPDLQSRGAKATWFLLLLAHGSATMSIKHARITSEISHELGCLPLCPRKDMGKKSETMLLHSMFGRQNPICSYTKFSHVCSLNNNQKEMQAQVQLTCWFKASSSYIHHHKPYVTYQSYNKLGKRLLETKIHSVVKSC